MFALEIPSYHIDFLYEPISVEEFIQTIQPKILEIKKSLNNPEIGFVEITGLNTIDDVKEKKRLFFLISGLLGELVIQNPNNQELVTLIRDANNETSFAHHNGKVPFHTDGAFLSNPPNIIGIWVEEVAISGGATSLINFKNLLLQCTASETGRTHLSTLQTLVPFHIHDSYHKPNTPTHIMAPVIHCGLRFRLDLIVQGIYETLPENREKLLSAVYFFDNEIGSCEKTTLLMKQDNMYFLNNQYILHNRAPFIGDRKIWRTWMKEKTPAFESTQSSKCVSPPQSI